MRRKLHSQPGFTLIEVLLVVALIVILLAISIPAVMGAVNDTRCKADAKYERAAMARVNAHWASGALEEYEKTQKEKGALVVYAYDAQSGTLIIPMGTNPGSVTPYGSCRKHGHTSDEGCCIYVEYNTKTRSMRLCWAEVGQSGYSGGLGWGNNLCSEAQ